MPQLTRRQMLLSSTTLPLWASCSSYDMSLLSTRPVDVLARDLKVCAATYVQLHAGTPSAPVSLSGCNESPGSDRAVFQAASLTKPVVAYVALQLAQEGQLDLQAPVSQYLPHGYIHYHSVLERAPGDAHDVVAPHFLEAITAAQLLQHSSGLPNWSSGNLALDATPGSRWGYSGEGYMLLQAMLETVTQRDLADVLKERVFDPLGMIDSSMVWHEGLIERAVPAGRSTFGLRPRVRFHHAAAAASLYTTASDYARFMSAVLKDDPLLQRMLSRSINVDQSLGLAWGLGWGIERVRDNLSLGPCLWQWGNNPGFRAFAMASTQSKHGFVILTNSEQGMPLAASLARTVLPEAGQAFRFSWVA